ncbi:outer membrane protein assembly factor BamE [Vibrio sp. 10N.222.52.C3]|uniref:outer membrane protein assembly factor BamE domain-containing protein n=1 Tax=Vibrio sp. 10N.222.52.C3 TaxID=3229631 RepID=UPI00354B07F7
MKTMLSALGLVTLLSGCASVDKLEVIAPGMTQDEVTAVLGNPERVSQNTNQQQYHYTLREAPHWWALTGCVAFPAVIPTLGVMWASDGCLGEAKPANIMIRDGKVVATTLDESK